MSLADTLIAVAEYLGDGWSVGGGHQSDGSDGYLYGPDRLQVRAVYGGNRFADRNRYRFTASMPDRDWWDRCRIRYHQLPTCSVVAGRHPRLIARALERAVLAPWRPILTETIERATVHADHQARRDRLAAELVALLPDSTWSPEYEQLRFPGDGEELAHGSFRLQAAPSVEVQLRVPTSQLYALAEAIAALRSTPPTG